MSMRDELEAEAKELAYMERNDLEQCRVCLKIGSTEDIIVGLCPRCRERELESSIEENNEEQI